jgi:predicted DNA-binding protein with PD1-like motif
LHCIETEKTRKFIGEFTRGMEIQRALSKILKDKNIKAGVIKIIGHVENIEILTNGSKGPLTISRKIDQNCQIVHCEGFISELDGNFNPVLYSVIGIETETGLQTISGVLKNAKVIVCEFILDSFDDVFIRKQYDQRILLPCWIETFTNKDGEFDTFVESVENSEENSNIQHEDYSKELEEEDDLGEGIFPGTGDKIDHHKFGKCTVVKVEKDNEIVQIRLPSTRIARLGIQYLNLSLIRELEDGKKLFKASKNRK